MPLMPSDPIGVFDSGVGGLTVFKSLAKLLPNESIIYLGDTARVPYGTKSAETVIRYALACTEFLVSKGIKLLVVACNTASAMALEELRAHFRIPVIGVIEPSAREAVRRTRSGRIGVIGTPSTIKSGAYQKSLISLRADAQVYTRACPLFVPLVEEGWIKGSITKQIVEVYLSELLTQNIDTLILGCTHYPILYEVISEVTGPDVTIVDSADSTAVVTRDLLLSMSMLNEKTKDVFYRFFVTDSPDRFADVGRIFLGCDLHNVFWIDF